MASSNLRASLLFGVAGLASLGFGMVAAAVSRGKTTRMDRRAKRLVHQVRGAGARGSTLQRAALSTTPLGKWWAYVPPALSTAARLYQRGRRQAALTIAGTAVATALAPAVLERLVEHRFPPPERHEPSKQSFPSGHALQTSAMALGTTYVLSREGELAPVAALPATLGSLAAGAGRLLLDRHWLSDVIGGYLAGVALGATCAGFYELTADG